MSKPQVQDPHMSSASGAITRQSTKTPISITLALSSFFLLPDLFSYVPAADAWSIVDFHNYI